MRPPERERHPQPLLPQTRNNMNGKGSRPRNNYSKKYRDNYDAIFKKQPSKDSKAPVPQKDGNKKISTKALGDLGFKMYGIR
jgi:hypothetical protein